METIHFKTVDPISQELLRSASDRGIQLSWDRYEKLQPQDGFLRIGLSCPYGCLQGPCRIDPFGRGAERGICGLDKDQMAAALLLRLALQGTLEAQGAAGTVDLSRTGPLDGVISAAAAKLGGGPLAVDEIAKTALLLSRPAGSPESLVIQALRLSLLALGFLDKRAAQPGGATLPLQAGYGLLAGKEVVIGVCGQPSAEFVETLAAEVSRELPGRGQVVSLGSWIPLAKGYLPCVCTSGEAELLISSGKIHLLVAGPGTDPAVKELCGRLGISVASEKDPAGELIRDVRRFASLHPQKTFIFDPAHMEEVQVIQTSTKLQQTVLGARLALLGGTDMPQQPLGWIPGELAAALRGAGWPVAAWGDAGLWITKRGQASRENTPPVCILDGEQGPLTAVRAFAASGKPSTSLKVCYAGLKSCQDLAVMLGLAELGFKVSVAVPLPLWGSEAVRSLLQEKLAAQGGTLAHFDHPAHAQELLDWFLKDS